MQDASLSSIGSDLAAAEYEAYLRERNTQEEAARQLSNCATPPAEEAQSVAQHQQQKAVEQHDDGEDDDVLEDDDVPAEQRDEFALSTLKRGGLSRCPECHSQLRIPDENITVTHLFPVPTRHEVLLSIIGTDAAAVAEDCVRSVPQVVEILTALRTILRGVVKHQREPGIVEISDLVSPTHHQQTEAENDDDEDCDCSWLCALMHSSAHFFLVKGFADYLSESGVTRVNSTLRYMPRQSSSNNTSRRLSQRVVVGLQMLEQELQHISEQGTPQHCKPAKSSIGTMLTLFEEKQRKLDGPFPANFADLLDWIKLRNFFYVCYVTCDADKFYAGGGQEEYLEESETWFTYMADCRSICQEVLEGIEQFHATLRCPNSNHATLRDSAIVRDVILAHEETFGWSCGGAYNQRRQLGVDSTPGGKGVLLGMTPPPSTPPSERHSSPSAAISPGDFLLRTPQDQADKYAYYLSHPDVDNWYRDPDSQHAGLLNMRQCCYVNCLVQMLYFLPGFASCVMEFPSNAALRARKNAAASGLVVVAPSSSDENNTKGENKDNNNNALEEKIMALYGDAVPPSCKIVHRLQALFAYLKISNSSCVSPIPLLEAVAMYSKYFDDRAQHDPHEFVSALVGGVKEAYEHMVKTVEEHRQLVLQATTTAATAAEEVAERGVAEGTEEEGVTSSSCSAPTDKENASPLNTKGATTVQGASQTTRCSLFSSSAAATAPEEKKTHPVLAELDAELDALQRAQRYIATIFSFPFVSNNLSADGTWSNGDAEQQQQQQGDDNTTLATSESFIPLYFDTTLQIPNNKQQPQHRDPLSDHMLTDDKHQQQQQQQQQQRVYHLTHCMDDFFNEYRDDPSCVTKATIRSVPAASKLPGFLCFYLPSRVSLAASSSKDHCVFKFPTTLSLSAACGSASTTNAEQQQQQQKREGVVRTKERIYTLAHEQEGLRKSLPSLDSLVRELEKSSRSSVAELDNRDGKSNNNSGSSSPLLSALAAASSLRKQAVESEASVTTQLGAARKELLDQRAALYDCPQSPQGEQEEEEEEHQNSKRSSCLYRLRSVTVHAGSTSTTGHYFTYICLSARELASNGDADETHDDDDAELRHWYRFDDARVDAVDDTVVLSEETAANVYLVGYVLASRRIEEDEDQWIRTAEAAAATTAMEKQALQKDSLLNASAVPPHLKKVIDREDMRKQLRLAQRLSSTL